MNTDLDRAVVFLPSWVGDAVMATPALRALRGELPETWLLGVMRPGLDELLAGTPWLNEMLVDDLRGLLGPWRVARQIRRFEPQMGVLLPNSFRSALALRLSGTPVRAGYNRDGRGMLLTHRITPPDRARPLPAVRYYIDLMSAALGTSDIDPRLELATTDEERQAADALLHDLNGPYVLLNPGANRADKRWPAERFAAVGDALAKRHGLHVVVNASPRERDVAERIIAASRVGGAANLAERGVTLGSLKAVIERAAILITNDTGPRHIAAALGTPVVTLFGPTDHRWTTLPLSHAAKERIVLAEPFLPEELMADRHERVCRIDRIAASDVLAAAESLLTTTT
jgi:heptosyltransferase II